MPSLRTQSLFQCILAQIRASKRRFIRIAHFSVQSNHIHLIVEAADRRSIGRGMKGLAVRVARRVNALLGSRGSVWEDRYFARALKTPREVHNALVYVLFNREKHVLRRRPIVSFSIDSRSSAFLLGAGTRWESGRHDWPIAAPTTWLLRAGWRCVTGR
jgi:REP element-mobilizing transposase RayT